MTEPVEISEGGAGKKRKGNGGADGKGDSYKTTDLEQAAILRTLGHKFIGIEEKKMHGKRRLQFVFATSEVGDDLRKILNDDLQLNPRALLNNYNNMRTLANNKGFK